MVVVNKVLEEDNKVVLEVSKKSVKEYNDFFLKFFKGKVGGWRW